MRFIFLLVGVFIFASFTYGQKQALDTSVYIRWPTVTQSASSLISSDGRYVTYSIDTASGKSHTLVFRAVQGNWKKEISNVLLNTVAFSEDGRLAIFARSQDIIGIVLLGTDSIAYISPAANFKMSTPDNISWMGWQPKGSHQLIIRDLINGFQTEISGVSEYMFSADGATLIYEIQDSSSRGSYLFWVDLTRETLGRTVRIWEGKGPNNFVFGEEDGALAFTSLVGGKDAKAIWFYKRGEVKAVKMLDDELLQRQEGLKIQRVFGFNERGNKVFLLMDTIRPPRMEVLRQAPVHIWRYSDAQLEAEREKAGGDNKSYVGVFNIRDQKLIRLQKTGDIIFPSGVYGDYICFKHKEGEGDPSEFNWNPASHSSAILESTESGKRRVLGDMERNIYYLSAAGKFVVFYDRVQDNYFSYEIGTGRIRNLTNGLGVVWRPDSDMPIKGVSAIAAWLDGDSAFLLYDRNDIWMIDPAGRWPPVNITNGYGHRNHLVFGLASPADHTIIRDGEKLILCAFNQISKDNGYYSKVLNEKGDPKCLTMGPYVYTLPSSIRGITRGASFNPVKATRAGVYVVRRMSALESPNYFATSNFVDFTPLSDVYPEKAYNWLRTELFSWKTADGKAGQGVLYKPENFDPGKKYPVIIHYYEIVSNRLNIYYKPEPSDGDLNIPWFVSRGYLVLMPDIHFKLGYPGPSDVDWVGSAARSLAQLPWVDGKRMGLEGFSFGGYLTNFLVTHTKIFAAACTASGLSDLVSAYGSIMDGGMTKEGMFETGQYRMGTDLWARKDLFIENSPIFRANEVTTPLLLMHTTNDGTCPFVNELEFFTGLRRLGKKVWMLQYDHADHGVYGSSALDFSGRLTEFFDYFLKGATIPDWMKS